MVDGERLMFDLLGLKDGVFLMRDRKTGTVWTHLDGKAIAGPLEGKRLEMIPLLQTTWESWVNEYPESTVLAYDSGYQRAYRSVVIGRSSFDESFYGDDRLPSNTLVVGVEVKDVYKGYPVSALADVGGVFNDEINGQPVVVAYDAGRGTGIAYSRDIGEGVVTFRATSGVNGALLLQDVATGSTWDMSGKGVDGPLSNETLVFIPSIISEWYGWSAYHPQTDLFAEE